MTDPADARRRGRREGSFDPASPAHRRLFAQRLRDLRQDCGNPAYRALSAVAHCGSGSLSEAASGRRMPTWETTRGYVTGCLRYAGREHEVPAAVTAWRRVWEEADRLERERRSTPATADPERPLPPASEPTAANGPVANSPVANGPVANGIGGNGTGNSPVPSSGPSTAAARGTRPAPRMVLRSRMPRALAAVAVTLVVLGLLSAATAPARPMMTGLFNIVAVPFTWSGPQAPAALAEHFQQSLVRKLKTWSDGAAAIQMRTAGQADRVQVDAATARTRALDGIARTHGADVVLTGRFLAVGDQLTVVIEFFVSDRTLGGSPEFAGRHEVSVSEPADVFGRNLAISDELTDGALAYLEAIADFVRGLGNYALDDYPAAEAAFLNADARWDELGQIPGARRGRYEVLDVMLGNTIGRADTGRVTEAAAYYRRALEANPSYSRAQLGLAEATRVASGCTPHETQAEPLRRALDLYRAVLTGGDGEAGSSARDMPLLEMKARLGLGLTYQCLTLARLEPRRAEADEEFNRVVRLGETAVLSTESTRHALRLAAEAHAGRALDALTTDGYAVAVREYEAALRLLGQIDVVRSTNVERELVFLGNLRAAYQGLDRPIEARLIDRRIAAADDRLASLR